MQNRIPHARGRASGVRGDNVCKPRPSGCFQKSNSQGDCDFPSLCPPAASAKLCGPRTPCRSRCHGRRPVSGDPAGCYLPETCPAGCARVCVSKRISSPSSLRLAGGTRSRATSCRVAASPHPPGSLPTHPAPSPPCAPLLPLLLLQWPLLCSLWRRDLEKREEEKGGRKESRYL